MASPTRYETVPAENGTCSRMKKPKRITVNDRMQRGYSYLLIQPTGQNYDEGFRPDLTPPELLALGVFGGKYMTDCRAEFPASWYLHAKLSLKKRDPSLNLFGVHASQSLAVWRKNGWIYADDPRGWFQWYCRYYRGRRSLDDERQIRRWRQMARHVAQLRQACDPGDLDCRRRQRQALLHWAYDSRTL